MFSIEHKNGKTRTVPLFCLGKPKTWQRSLNSAEPVRFGKILHNSNQGEDEFDNNFVKNHGKWILVLVRQHGGYGEIDIWFHSSRAGSPKS